MENDLRAEWESVMSAADCAHGVNAVPRTQQRTRRGAGTDKELGRTCSLQGRETQTCEASERS